MEHPAEIRASLSVPQTSANPFRLLGPAGPSSLVASPTVETTDAHSCVHRNDSNPANLVRTDADQDGQVVCWRPAGRLHTTNSRTSWLMRRWQVMERSASRTTNARRRGRGREVRFPLFWGGRRSSFGRSRLALLGELEYVRLMEIRIGSRSRGGGNE